jgi:hypothetical protein
MFGPLFGHFTTQGMRFKKKGGESGAQLDSTLHISLLGWDMGQIHTLKDNSTTHSLEHQREI